MQSLPELTLDNVKKTSVAIFLYGEHLYEDSLTVVTHGGENIVRT
jgi:hypothetical protein